MKINILIVEDEVAIREMIRFALESVGFVISKADNPRMAEQQIARRIPDLILLDWMMPGSSGIDFAKQLKRKSQTQHTPIIMLTAKAEEDNKIKGFESGVDDYMTKPFSSRELIARIKTVLRRSPSLIPESIIQIGNLCVHSDAHQVTINDQLIELAPIEFKMLNFFVTHPDRIYSREQLLDQVWSEEKHIDNRTVDVQIRRLRGRLKPHGYDAHIKTIHGAGYQFIGNMPVAS